MRRYLLFIITIVVLFASCNSKPKYDISPDVRDEVKAFLEIIDSSNENELETTSEEFGNKLGGFFLKVDGGTQYTTDEKSLVTALFYYHGYSTEVELKQIKGSLGTKDDEYYKSLDESKQKLQEKRKEIEEYLK